MRQSSSFSQKRRLKRVFGSLGMLVLLALIIWGLSWFSHASFMHINFVQITGADQDIVPVLQSVAEQSLDGNYLGLFSKRNALIYSRSSLISALRRADPRIDMVNVSLSGFHQVSVSVTQRTPAAMVCSGFPDFDPAQANDSPDQCYFTDTAGYVYARAPKFSGQPYETYYMPELPDSVASSSDNAVLGQYATTTEEFTRLHELYAGAKTAGIDVRALLVNAGGEYEMYASRPLSTTSDPIVIYFDSGSSLSKQLSNLTTFWSQSSAIPRNRHATSSLEYIDVRYGSNVFYR